MVGGRFKEFCDGHFISSQLCVVVVILKGGREGGRRVRERGERERRERKGINELTTIQFSDRTRFTGPAAFLWVV